MKKNLILACLVMMLCQPDGFGQNNDLKNHPAMVQFIESKAEGTITILAVGFAKKKKESQDNAISDAFYTILFRGIPASQYKTPMISNENAFKNNPVIVEILDGGYVSFLTDSIVREETTLKRKEDGNKGIQTQMELTVNCVALRRYLEQKNIIRKFGI